MSSFRPLLFSLLVTSLLISFLPFSFSHNETVQDSGKTLSLSLSVCFVGSTFGGDILYGNCAGQRKDVVLSWGRTERLVSDNSSEEEMDSTMVLAPRKTYRKDPLNDFKMYNGGWNISNPHYWAVSLDNFHLNFMGLLSFLP